MWDSHRLVSTSGGGSFHESPFMAVIARIPAGTNFAASGIGSISFQGNFIADRLCLATSRTFQADISSRPCFLGISSSQSFKTKPSEVKRKSFQNASSTAFVFSLHSHLDGVSIFLRVAWRSNLGRGFQANRTEHHHKEPLPDRGLAGGVSPERKGRGQRHGRVGGRGG